MTSILVACTCEPGFPSGPPIIAAAIPWGLLGPYRLGAPATHARIGWEANGQRKWLDGASPVAKHSRRDAARQATWRLRATDDEVTVAVGHIERLAGVAYDWPQILEQTIPFLADHGGLAGHEICTSLVALVLARMGGRWLTMARSFLGHGCRHPERMLRMFAASEGSLLIGVNTAT